MNISRDGHTSSSSAGGENDLLFIGFNQDSGESGCTTDSFFAAYQIRLGSVQRQSDMSCRKCDLVLLNIRCFLVAEDFTNST